jgi:hypothetical protein
MENKPKNIVLLVIIIILLVAGLIYILSNKTEKKDINNTLQENKNEIPVNKDNLSLLTYKSSKVGYEINYPLTWVIGSSSELESFSYFQIKNSVDVILPGSNSEMREIDSIISIQVSNYGIDPLIHKKIDDVIIDPKFGISKTDRINNVRSMIIGGKNLRVEKLDSSKGETYSFLYNGNVYNISFKSGSENQYNLDHKVFTNFISSFVLY